MKYLLEILKIVEGGISTDRTKVIAYTAQLAKKLSTDGEREASKRLQRILGGPIDSTAVTPAFLNPTSRLPVDNESRFSLAEESQISVDDVKIFLSDKVRNTVSEFLRNVQATDRLLAMGMAIHPSLLIYGPPGCGKTELARFIASQLQLPLLTARSDAIVSSYLGNTSKNIRTLFDHASARPCVLFLDEFDAIAKLRDDQHELGELKRVVISLLQNIDALDKKTVLIAATNHDHLLDPAVWRRFASKIELGRPELDVRIKIFEHFLGDFSKKKDSVLLASITESFSGADIRQLSEDVKRESILDGRNTIKIECVLKRILDTNASGKKNGEDYKLADQLKIARAMNKKAFTVRRLATIFNCSTGQVSKLLNQT